MKHKVLRACLVGALIGLFIAVWITIVISLLVGDGRYYAVVPSLAGACGSETLAVLLQTVCALLYGAAWGGASNIWQREDWSLLRQTATHLAVCSAATLPIAYLLHWMEHSLRGVLLYFAIFFGIYLMIWLIQYGIVKRRLRQINARLEAASGKRPED